MTQTKMVAGFYIIGAGTDAPGFRIVPDGHGGFKVEKVPGWNPEAMRDLASAARALGSVGALRRADHAHDALNAVAKLATAQLQELPHGEGAGGAPVVIVVGGERAAHGRAAIVPPRDCARQTDHGRSDSDDARYAAYFHELDAWTEYWDVYRPQTRGRFYFGDGAGEAGLLTRYLPNPYGAPAPAFGRWKEHALYHRDDAAHGRHGRGPRAGREATRGRRRRARGR